MIDIGSPLAAIYSTSTMEHHHFNMAVIILQQVCKYLKLIKMGKIVISEFLELGFRHLPGVFLAYQTSLRLLYAMSAEQSVEEQKIRFDF